MANHSVLHIAADEETFMRKTQRRDAKGRIAIALNDWLAAGPKVNTTGPLPACLPQSTLQSLDERI